jgi:hypothetical protein
LVQHHKITMGVVLGRPALRVSAGRRQLGLPVSIDDVPSCSECAVSELHGLNLAPNCIPKTPCKSNHGHKPKKSPAVHWTNTAVTKTWFCSNVHVCGISTGVLGGCRWGQFLNGVCVASVTLQFVGRDAVASSRKAHPGKSTNK